MSLITKTNPITTNRSEIRPSIMLPFFFLGAILLGIVPRFEPIGMREALLGIWAILYLAGTLLEAKEKFSPRRAAMIVMALAGAITIRLSYWNGLYGHDDWVYLFYARSMYHGIFQEVFGSLWGIRYVVVMPILILYKLIGPSYATAFAPTFLASILEFAMVGIICWILFRSWKSVQLSLLLIAVYPLSAFTASTIRGDMESSIMVGLALIPVALIAVGGEWADRHRKVLSFAAGFFSVAGVWAKPTNIISLPAVGLSFLLLLAWKQIRFRDLLWPVLGICAWFLCEIVIDALLNQPLLHRFKVAFEAYHQQLIKGDLKNDLTMRWSYGPALFFDLTSLNKVIADWNVNQYVRFGMWGWLMCVGAITTIRKRTSNLILSIWFLFSLLYLMFGTMSLHLYLPLHKEPRYFMLVSIPGIVLLADFLRRLSTRHRVLRIGVFILLGALVFSSLSTLKYNHERYIDKTLDADLLVDEVQAHPERIYFTNHHIVQHLELFTHFRRPEPSHHFPGSGGGIRDLSFFKRNDDIGSYLILREPIEGYRCCYDEVFAAFGERRLTEVDCLGREGCVYHLFRVMEVGGAS